MNEPSGSTRTLRRDIVFAFALGLACCLAWLIRDVLVMLYVSALFAVVLSPMVRFTAQLRIRRWQPFKGSAVFVLLLVVAAALTAFGFLALPPVISDLHGFAQEMPARLPAQLERLKSHSSGATPGHRGSQFPASGLCEQCRHLSALLHQRLGGQALRSHHGLHSDHLFHSGRRPRLSLVSLLLPARTAANASTQPSSARRSAWASGCSARAA